MLRIPIIPKSFKWIWIESFAPMSKRLFHTTPPILADIIEQVKRQSREVEPSPPLPKLKMEPFVKNLFLGKVDTNVLAYPEFDLGRLNVLEDMASELQKFMNGLYSSESSGIENISSEIVWKLKHTGLFGVNIAEKFGGAELTCMEINRLGEVIASDLSLFQALNVHISYISQFFSNYASEQQKEQFLPPLASGELQCGVAIWEKNAGVDISQISCSGVLVDDVYKISGTKMWVSNMGFVDKLLVFVTIQDSSNHKNWNVSCLLVDKHSPGITAKRMDTIGLNGFDLWEVTFDRTPVPVENLIGEEGNGLQMIHDVVNGRFTIVGAAYACVLRKMLDITVKHATFKDVFGKPLKDFETVQQQLCEVSALIYSLESISYLTASFLDDYEDPDCSVEVAIVHLYASQALSKGFQICSSLLGSQAFIKDGLWDQMHRDILFASTAQFSADYLRQYISISCLQHVGKVKGELLKQKRLPFEFPEIAMKDLLNLWDTTTDVPMIPKVVSYHLHPAFEEAAGSLELCISYLRYICDELMLKWGAKVVDSHADLSRVADIAVDCYTTTAVLARASRSLCIGLRDNNEECMLAQRITCNARRNVLQTSKLISESPYQNFDVCNKSVADILVNHKGYKLGHPLARNF